MKAVKCIIDINGSEQKRHIKITSKEQAKELERELAGTLFSMSEFKTTKEEVISGDQIICKI